MQLSKPIDHPSDKPVLGFLSAWIVLNLFQAGACELHPDEAYYWVYSRFLDWGYFDHPPMVALFIRAGYALFADELGVRLLTVISQAAALFLLWRLAKSYGARPLIFCITTACLTIIHVYGFTTTPDSALFFFAVCFFYLYKSYVEEDRISTTLLLTLVTAGLLYSKYHGVLLIIITLCANPALFRRGSFWIITFGALLLFSPHILWQISNHYPSLQYHLYERSSSGYKPEYTLTFIPGQLLVAGPLVGWLFYYRAWSFRTKQKDLFIRMLKVNAIVFPVFLLLLTFKQNIQPHWTLIAYIPILLLAVISLSQKRPRWFAGLAVANIVLILIFRSLIIFPTPLVTKIAPLYAYFGNKTWTEDLLKQTLDTPVVVLDHWQNAARFDFYSRSTLAYAYASYRYRRSQFDYFPLEDSLRGKPVWIQSPDSLNKNSRYMGSERNGFLTPVKEFHSYQKIQIGIGTEKLQVKTASELPVSLQFTAPKIAGYGLNNHGIDSLVHLRYHYVQRKPDTDTSFSLDSVLKRVQLPVYDSVSVQTRLKAPDKPGQYELIFSLQADPLPGGRNSRRIAVTVY
ncbi:MAG: glycosyltransferase family 39 protein [Mucilaginibacter polytrichastri]|nr:glycosyltransferase family 39 protein [Mucilaginibacter polytrichastri]